MYAKWLKLPFKRLPHERPLFNVDGTMNKMGSLKYYVDLQVQMGTKHTDMRFFLADLGCNALTGVKARCWRVGDFES